MPATRTEHPFVLTLSGANAQGAVHAVSGLLAQAGCSILDALNDLPFCAQSGPMAVDIPAIVSNPS